MLGNDRWSTDLPQAGWWGGPWIGLELIQQAWELFLYILDLPISQLINKFNQPTNQPIKWNSTHRYQLTPWKDTSHRTGFFSSTYKLDPSIYFCHVLINKNKLNKLKNFNFKESSISLFLGRSLYQINNINNESIMKYILLGQEKESFSQSATVQGRRWGGGRRWPFQLWRELLWGTHLPLAIPSSLCNRSPSHKHTFTKERFLYT